MFSYINYRIQLFLHKLLVKKQVQVIRQSKDYEQLTINIKNKIYKNNTIEIER